MKVFDEQHEMFRAAGRSDTAEMANRVAYECVQMHGGYGYMREYPIERFARDVRPMTIGGGTSEIMREIIVKQLLS